MSPNPVKILDLQRIWLAGALVFAFCAVLGLSLLRAYPEANKDIVVYMIGQLSGMATMALGYYFTQKAGQDAADAAKTENTGKMADAVVAAAKASTPVTTQAAEAAQATAEAAQHEADRYIDPAEELFKK